MAVARYGVSVDGKTGIFQNRVANGSSSLEYSGVRSDGEACGCAPSGRPWAKPKVRR